MGDIWFFAGQMERWGDAVIPEASGFRGKFPMWVGGNELPIVAVVHTDGDPAEGIVSLDPTAEGLPGPLPSSLMFPLPGCWQVTATLGMDSAQITVYVPPNP